MPTKIFFSAFLLSMFGIIVSCSKKDTKVSKDILSLKSTGIDKNSIEKINTNLFKFRHQRTSGTFNRSIVTPQNTESQAEIEVVIQPLVKSGV